MRDRGLSAVSNLIYIFRARLVLAFYLWPRRPRLERRRQVLGCAKFVCHPNNHQHTPGSCFFGCVLFGQRLEATNSLSGHILVDSCGRAHKNDCALPCIERWDTEQFAMRTKHTAPWQIWMSAHHHIAVNHIHLASTEEVLLKKRVTQNHVARWSAMRQFAGDDRGLKLGIYGVRKRVAKMYKIHVQETDLCFNFRKKMSSLMKNSF